MLSRKYGYFNKDSMFQLTSGETSIVSLDSLQKTLSIILLPASPAFISGYVACRLLFGERRWRKSPKKEMTIYSVSVGSLEAIIIWAMIYLLKGYSGELLASIEGNEPYLTAVLLLMWAGVKVVLVAILLAIKKWKRKNAKSK